MRPGGRTTWVLPVKQTSSEKNTTEPGSVGRSPRTRTKGQGPCVHSQDRLPLKKNLLALSALFRARMEGGEGGGGGGGKDTAPLLLQTEGAGRGPAPQIATRSLVTEPAASLGRELCYSFLDGRYRTRNVSLGCGLNSQGTLCAIPKLPLTSKLNTWAQGTGRPTVITV